MSARILFACSALVLFAGCERERVGRIEGPPLTIAPAASSASSVDRADAAAQSQGPPVTATFIDLTAKGAPIHARACEDIVIGIAKGKALLQGETLAIGDIAIFEHTTEVEVKGEGIALVAVIKKSDCGAVPTAAKHVIRAATAKPLTFAGGKMTAYLDAEKAISPDAYVGRLEGTAAVKEHTHPGTWEILCAIEGAGTFSLGDEKRHLSPRGVVVVPPDTKHSWLPDEGMRLKAFQIYYPPGPEQRFRAMAEGADGGVSTSDAGR